MQLRQVVVGNVDVNVKALVSREALPQSTLEAAGQDQLQDQWFGDCGKAVAYTELE